MIKSQKYLIIFAVALNCLITFLSFLHHQPINVDGIIYIKTAQAYLDQGFHVAVANYPWPFYSIFIAITSKLTHLSLINAGFILNTILTSILFATFVTLIKEFGGTLLEQYLGLLTLSIYPFLNNDRYNILRDFGYYAFFLLSFLFFIYYLRHIKWRDAIFFTLCLLIALLFRIESILLLLLAPIIVLFKNELNLSQKILATIKLYIPCIILGSLGLAVVFIKYHTMNINFKDINIFFNVLISGPSYIVTNLSAKTILIQRDILNVYGQDSATVFLAGGMIAIFFDTFFTTMNVFYTAIVCYALMSKKIILEVNARLALYGFIIIYSLILFGFVLTQIFLPGRYIVPLCLLLMLLIPFAFTRIYQYYLTNRKKYWLPVIFMLGLLYTMIHAFGHFGTSKSYIVTAGDWIKNNTPISSQLYSNDPTLAFYSERAGTLYQGIPNNDDWLMTLKNTPLNHYDYLALVIHNDELQKEKQVLLWLNKKPIQQWQNNFGDQALIFELHH